MADTSEGLGVRVVWVGVDIHRGRLMTFPQLVRSTTCLCFSATDITTGTKMMIPKNPKHGLANVIFANFGKKQHPKVDKLRIKTTNSKIPTNHSKLMANMFQEKKKKKKRMLQVWRVGGTWSIYLHSRSFGGQMFLGKYNTYISWESGIYIWTCIYRKICHHHWTIFGKSLRPLASWVDTSYKILQVLLVF